jgi:hypothetical protein
MIKDRGKDSLADAWTKRIKNNRIIAACFVLSLILAGAASLTDSFDKLERFASRIWRKPEAPTQSAIKPESKPTNDEVTSSKRIEQTTTGNNSPAVADVQGGVIIQQQNQE